MLENSSASTMLLLVAASLIGIGSIYQPTDVITQSRTDLTISEIGTVEGVWVYASSDGKACVAIVAVPYLSGEINFEWEFLLASDQSICDIFSKAIEGTAIEGADRRRLAFEGNGTDYSALPLGFRTILPVVDLELYRVHSVLLF